jgi:oligoribonuclease (3'-5' exoribonuclease)
MKDIIILSDLETTGGIGDESKADHLILEVGLLAVHVPSFTEVDSWSTPIRWPKHRILETANDFVLKMHTGNGLLSEIFNEPHPHDNVANGGLPSIWEAETMALGFLEHYADRAFTEMCGAGPEFDREFMKHHMPRLAKHWHYRNFDINAFWLLKQFMGEWEGGQKPQDVPQPHRALPDCRRELQAVIDFFAWIGNALKEPAQ